MNKKEIINILISRLEEKRRKLQVNRASYQKTSNKALGAMQSHSDTTKFQTGKLAENIENQLLILEDAMSSLASIDDKKLGCVQIGSLVKIDQDGKHSYLLIVPDGAGGEVIESIY